MLFIECDLTAMRFQMPLFYVLSRALHRGLGWAAQVALIAALWLAPADMAAASAWLRDTGDGFISATTRMSWPRDFASAPSRYDTLFLEYGLTGSVTVGLDFGHSVSGDNKQVAFVRLPVWRRDTGWIVANQLGLGHIGGNRILRPSLSIGRGTQTQHGYGWQSADLGIEIYPALGTWDVKLDLTWGIARPKGTFWVLQLQTGKQHGDPAFARLAPSIVRPISARTKLELGLTYGLHGENSIGAMAGMWADF